jgi:MtfA peptidase
MNPYGATNSAEFFAVAPETFFEEPQEFLTHHSRLYEQLRHYWLNPAQWAKL